MLDAALNSKTGGARSFRPAVSALAALAVALLAGCTIPQRDSVTVGSVPDDYRVNHPIIISDKEQSIDLPVSPTDRGMTKTQRVALGGFLSQYDRSASPVLNILAPSGALNDVAAVEASREMVKFARAAGVPKGRIVVSSYQAPSPDESSPIRVTYTSLRAHTDKCGRWPDDLVQAEAATDNKHYADFGCSYQNNLAAQVANPADLIGPRKMSEVDAEKRGVVIDEYRKAPDSWSPEIDY